MDRGPSLIVLGGHRLREHVDKVRDEFRGAAERAGYMYWETAMIVFFTERLRKALVDEHQDVIGGASLDGIMEETAGSKLGRELGQPAVLER